MAVTTSTRLGITRWSAETDPLNRTQFDGDHALLDSLVAIDVQDLLANRPAPGTRGRFFSESSASAGLPGATWRDDGSSWRAVGSRIQSNAAADIGQIVRGSAAQTQPLSQWQDSTGAPLLNVTSGGSLVVPAHGVISSQAEIATFGARASWDTGGTTYQGLIINGVASQTANLQEWRDSTGAVLSSIRSTGGLWVTTPSNPSVVVGNSPTLANGYAFLGHVTTAGTWFTDTVANEGVLAASLSTGKRLRIGKSSGTPALTPLSLSDEAAQATAIIKGQASQSGNLTEWQSSTAAVMARVDATGTHWTYGSAGGSVNGAVATVGGSNTTAGYLAWFGPNTTRLGYMGNNGNATTTDQGVISLNAGTFLNAATAPGLVTHIVRGAASQTANLQEWQNSAGSIMAAVQANGSIWGVNLLNPANSGPYLAIGPLGLEVINQGLASGNPFGIRGMAGQTGDLQMWRNSAAALMSRVDAGGSISVWGAGGSGTNGQVQMSGGSASNAGYFAWFGPNGTRIGYMGNNGNATVSDQGFLSLQTGTFMVAGQGAAIVPFAVRPQPSQTANLAEFQNSAASNLATIGSNGTLTVLGGANLYSASGSLGVNLAPYTASARAAVATANTNEIGVLVRGMSGQTGDLQQWQNNSGTVIAGVTNGGGLYSASTVAFWPVGSSQPLSPAGHGASLTVVNQGPAYVGQIIKGSASQTEDLFEWQDSGGTVRAAVTSTGNVQGTGGYTTLSDAASKSNVRALPHRAPLDVIGRLRPVMFDYAGGPQDQVGFIADEVLAHLPHAVTPFGGDPLRLGLRSEAIVAYLVAAVQELDRRTAVAA